MKASEWNALIFRLEYHREILAIHDIVKALAERRAKQYAQLLPPPSGVR